MFRCAEGFLLALNGTFKRELKTSFCSNVPSQVSALNEPQIGLKKVLTVPIDLNYELIPCGGFKCSVEPLRLNASSGGPNI